MLAKTPKYAASGARISSDGRHRFSLWREWREAAHDPRRWRKVGTALGEWDEPISVLFLMLNPSLADGEMDDATVRKCVGFARLWRFERMEIGNLFAWRARHPRDLFAARRAGADIIGAANQECIQRMAQRAGRIVCAWGAHAAGHEFHTEEVRGWLGPGPHYHLGLTASGQPRHPLYVPYAQKLLRMSE